MPASDREAISKELLDTLRNHAHTDSLAYQFESFKHLAIANSAGLALCAAALTTNFSERVSYCAPRGALLCAWGLVIAIGLIVWRWIWGTCQARHFLDLCLEAETRMVSRAEVAALALSPKWAWIPAVLAGFSLLFFFLAVWIVAIAVQH